MGTLPAGFRPSTPIGKTLAYHNNTTWEHYYFAVEANGDVKCIASNNTNYIPPWEIVFVLE